MPGLISFVAFRLPVPPVLEALPDRLFAAPLPGAAETTAAGSLAAPAEASAAAPAAPEGGAALGWMADIATPATLLAALAFGLALGACAAIVATRRLHGGISMDRWSGVQKIHRQPVPRIGGLGIYLALVAAAVSGSARTGRLADLAPGSGEHAMAVAMYVLGAILIAGLPAFAVGLAEDLTGRIAPRFRLYATLASGLIFAAVFGVGRDLVVMQWPGEPGGAALFLGLVVVSVGMSGVANATNIIDGVNGLASGSVAIMVAGLGGLAAMAGDVPLAISAWILLGAVSGFFVMNFPRGYIFLGDGGAYFGGFALAAIAVLATARNPEISPFVALLAIFYPVYETLFSIVRRVRQKGASPTQPDRLHLHSLIHDSFAADLSRRFGVGRNPLTSVLVWALPLAGVGLAAAAGGSGAKTATGFLIFVLVYGRVYARARRRLARPSQHAYFDRPGADRNAGLTRRDRLS